jgi:hypothetical protein
MSKMKFTDRDLYNLFVGLSIHYKECNERVPNMSSTDIACELTKGVKVSLESRHGENSLRELPESEKLKVYKVLDTFINASPLFRAEPRQRAEFNQFLHAANTSVVINNYYGRRHFCDNNSFLTGYIYASAFNRMNNSSHPWDCFNNNSNHHSHDNNDDKQGASILALALLVLVIIAAISACIAIYYLVCELVNNIERLWYNEGWLKASITLMSMTVTAALTSILAAAIIASPLTALVLAAGIANPVGIVIFISISLVTVITAACTWFANIIQTQVNEANNPDAFYPKDPTRFALTPANEAALIKKGLDPIKIKCAIAALRQDMGEKPNLSSTFGDMHARECLFKIRQLRKGELSSLTVNNMQFTDFNLTNSSPYSSLYASTLRSELSRRPSGIVYTPTIFRQPEASAPPYSQEECPAYAP